MRPLLWCRRALAARLRANVLCGLVAEPTDNGGRLAVTLFNEVLFVTADLHPEGAAYTSISDTQPCREKLGCATLAARKEGFVARCTSKFLPMSLLVLSLCQALANDSAPT